MMMCLISNVLLFIIIVVMFLKVKTAFMNWFVILLLPLLKILLPTMHQKETLTKEQIAKVYEALEYMTGLTQKDFSDSGISTNQC